MDKAGRLVIPKGLRQQIGLVAGAVEIEVDGSSLRIRPGDAAEFVDLQIVDGIPTLPRTGVAMSDDDVREIRLVDQR